jgi:23S rRNA pseudouridine1911/1915/1917 synthase
VLSLVVPGEHAGTRVDRFLAVVVPTLSRAAAQRLLAGGAVRVNGRDVPPSHRLRAGDCVHVALPHPESSELTPERTPLSLLYEDDDILVVDKPAGMVVHPGVGRPASTLANALVAYCPSLRGVGDEGRPGIVHRLDRDTSGILVVAKHPGAYETLAAQFREHTTERDYAALVCGAPPDRGTIDAPIGRSLRETTKQVVGGLSPREARTHFTVAERFERLGPGAGVFALLDVRLDTGRTHQIRVHLTEIGYPVVGDRTYGGGARRAVREAPAGLRPAFRRVERQLLHARRLGLHHPGTGAWVEFVSPLPEDFRGLLDLLRAWPRE